MRVDVATGLLGGASQVLSPHFDARPAGTLPELLVVHGISLPPGEFGGPWIDRLFTGTLAADAHPYFGGIAAQRVSAHALIRRDGRIVQYVPFTERAWHAGQSAWQGRPGCNDYSIGVELEGTDDTPYTDAQYASLAALTAALLAAYPSLSQQAIAGHSEVAPGRKTDPGPAFDWAHFRGLLEGALRGDAAVPAPAVQRPAVQGPAVQGSAVQGSAVQGPSGDS
ncbi:MAG: 1,6-anhydro-N-acetylmuramyl-L-alanine amidase AmpD [Gammaproteobacteria bacterium]|nr:1,6-anhydro-N-acetylmuramyl-L-alanine amidase AmpD [Gammaproteobacteria bacterium]